MTESKVAVTRVVDAILKRHTDTYPALTWNIFAVLPICIGEARSSAPWRLADLVRLEAAREPTVPDHTHALV